MNEIDRLLMEGEIENDSFPVKTNQFEMTCNIHVTNHRILILRKSETGSTEYNSIPYRSVSTVGFSIRVGLKRLAKEYDEEKEEYDEENEIVWEKHNEWYVSIKLIGEEKATSWQVASEELARQAHDLILARLV